MRLKVQRSEVLGVDMDRFLPFTPLAWHERVFRNSKRGTEHYCFLTWIAQQFEGSLFLDVGHKAGASAMCLASNPKNKVITFDIAPREKLKNPRFKDDWLIDLSSFKNIEFRIQQAQNVPETELSDADVILLDINHTGKAEKVFLDNLRKSKFSGLLIMDDVNCKLFPKLHELWESIEEPKWIIPFAHWSGTGVVSFGDFTLEVEE